MPAKTKEERAIEKANYRTNLRTGDAVSPFVDRKATVGDLAKTRRGAEYALLKSYQGKPGKVVEEGAVTGRIGQLLIAFDDGVKLWLSKSEAKFIGD